MPRISAEDRSASAFRAGGERPEPPKRMTAPAKELWREIVADRPIDFFRPGSLSLLEKYCQVTVEDRRIVRRLARMRVDDADYASWHKVTVANSAMCMSLGSKLRLTVQADVDRHSRKIEERGDASATDDLIGGSAVHGLLRVA